MTNLPPPGSRKGIEVGLKRRCDYEKHNPGPLHQRGPGFFVSRPQRYSDREINPEKYKKGVLK